MISIRTTPIKIVKNAKDWPSEYSCNFLEPGLVSYEDVDAGIAMLRKETILKMMYTFIGKPVVINHIDVTPKDFDQHAVGYITKVWYDDYLNWAMCNFILTDDSAKEKVARGYSVSCAYDVVGTGKGGEWHAIKYDEEITEGSGTHLALVTSPRYEGARISDCRMLVNSKRAIMREGEGKKNSLPSWVKDMASELIADKVPYKNIVDRILDDRKGRDWFDNKYDGNEFDLRQELEIKLGKKNENEITNKGSFVIFKNNKKEDTKMIKVYKKANQKAGAEVDEKDPTKQKWNGDNIFVQVENEYVSLTELAKHAKVKNEFVELQSVENEIEVNGTVHNIGELVENFKASKKNEDEEKEEKDKKEAKKKNKSDDEKDNGDQEKEEEQIKKDNDKDEEKENDKDEEEEEKKEAKKNEKKDLKHFIKLNTARENGHDVSSVSIDTMTSRVDRGVSRYGSDKK